MRQTWMLPAGLAGVLVLAGCTENQKSIYRTFKIGDDESVVTDAKQRVVTNTTVEKSSSVLGQINPSRVVCSEPSPDVAQVMSQAFNASLSVSVEGQGSGSGALGYSSAASLAQLGERLATIQLLRDELSALCQSYANGAVSATTYTLRLSRLDRKMVTLLMSEMAAGAFGRDLAALSSAASAGGKSVEMLKAEEEVRKAADAVATKRDELDAAQAGGNAETIAEKEEELLKAYQSLANATSEMLALELSGAGSSALASALGMPGGMDRDGRGPIAAGQIVELQRQFLDDDDLGTLINACVSATNLLFLPYDADGNIVQEDIDNYQKASSDAARLSGRVSDAAFLLDRQISERGKIREEIADLEAELAGLLAEAAAPETTDDRNLEISGEVALIQRMLVGFVSDETDADQEIIRLQSDLAQASESLAKARGERAKFISPLGQYCDEKGLDKIIAVAEKQPDDRLKRMQERKGIIEAEAQKSLQDNIERCTSVLGDVNAPAPQKALCEAVMESGADG